MVKIHLLDCFEAIVEKKAQIIAVRHNEQEVSFRGLKNRAQTIGADRKSVV